MKHINQSQLHELTELLRQREKELTTDLGHYLHDESGSDGIKFANHIDTAGDWVSANVLADQDIAMTRHVLLELYEIREALKRIEKHSYGVCVQCEESIPVARLFAQPSAIFCTNRLSALEKKSGLALEPTI